VISVIEIIKKEKFYNIFGNNYIFDIIFTEKIKA